MRQSIYSEYFRTLRSPAIVKWRCRIGGGLAALLVGAVAADAQEVPQPAQVIPQPVQEIPQPGAVAPGPPPPRASTGLEAESLPGELTEDIYQAPDDFRLGPTPVSDVNFLMDNLGLERPVRRQRHPDLRLGRGRLHRRVVWPRHSLGPAPAEPLRRRVLAQPDRLGDPEAAQARPVRYRIQR